VTDKFTAAIVIAALAASIAARWYRTYEPDLMILAAAAVAGIARGRWRQRRAIVPPGTTPLLLPVGVTGATTAGKLAEMFLFFLKVGGTLFGSGYVLISYLQSGLVDQLHWLDKRQVLDAVAVGQVTPGPLLTTATFLGYLLGDKFGGGSITWSLTGGIAATAAIFLPSFVFVALLGPVLPRIRRHPVARGALDAMNAAVVALIAVAGWQLGRAALTDWLTAAVFAGSLAALLIWRLNATWLVAAGAVAGAAAALVR
jgi:chromate transporter